VDIQYGTTIDLHNRLTIVRLTEEMVTFGTPYTRVVGPDPYLDPDWICIQSGLWIRIRIRNPDPDPGGQK
jgi:hypothetical protein